MYTPRPAQLSMYYRNDQTKWRGRKSERMCVCTREYAKPTVFGMKPSGDIICGYTVLGEAYCSTRMLNEIRLHIEYRFTHAFSELWSLWARDCFVYSFGCAVGCFVGGDWTVSVKCETCVRSLLESAMTLVPVILMSGRWSFACVYGTFRMTFARARISMKTTAWAEPEESVIGHSLFEIK